MTTLLHEQSHSQRVRAFSLIVWYDLSLVLRLTHVQIVCSWECLGMKLMLIVATYVKLNPNNDYMIIKYH